MITIDGRLKRKRPPPCECGGCNACPCCERKKRRRQSERDRRKRWCRANPELCRERERRRRQRRNARYPERVRAKLEQLKQRYPETEERKRTKLAQLKLRYPRDPEKKRAQEQRRRERKREAIREAVWKTEHTLLRIDDPVSGKPLLRMVSLGPAGVAIDLVEPVAKHLASDFLPAPPQVITARGWQPERWWYPNSYGRAQLRMSLLVMAQTIRGAR